MNAPDAAREPFALSNGEIEFLWWFIQGSIMDPNVRARLLAHWGLCPRHSLGFFAVEAAFRPHLIHGCSVLYSDLMRRAANLIGHDGLHRLIPDPIVRHQLRTAGPCHLCDLGYGPSSESNTPPEKLQQGRDLTTARRFADDNRMGWEPYVCGVCSGSGTAVRCRVHLVAPAAGYALPDLAEQRAYVQAIAAHLARFDASFHWKNRDTDTAEDRGALLAAIGWCSGWRTLLDGLSLNAPVGAADHE